MPGKHRSPTSRTRLKQSSKRRQKAHRRAAGKAAKAGKRYKR